MKMENAVVMDRYPHAYFRTNFFSQALKMTKPKMMREKRLSHSREQISFRYGSFTYLYIAEAIMEMCT
jgi:hypothetical protein